ncbi:Copper chaperone CopZ [Bhargavaea beijingensis]|uniref:Copper chaperone CopZ n=1 Tax=Bhargavaea beijingensis TaxID=426756 RepID=A0A1G6Y9X3_9BACL|nr:heavy-metal-associated domain-containing protein [Bhargavaea beijingensis]SDD87160.1 Copper chaperone CopZ [Bhargavaea beijingensis]
MKQVVLQMEALTCPSCIKKIEGALGKMDGVEQAKVLFNSGKVKARFDERKINAEEIERTVTKLGYPVLSKKMSQSAH